MPPSDESPGSPRLPGYDAARRELTGPNGTVRLSPTDARLLDYLIRHTGQHVTRAKILAAVFPGARDHAAVSSYVLRLRLAFSRIGRPLPLTWDRHYGWRLDL